MPFPSGYFSRAEFRFLCTGPRASQLRVLVLFLSFETDAYIPAFSARCPEYQLVGYHH
jgi:hypothetical protein